MQKIISNKGKAHHNIPSTTLISSLWIEKLNTNNKASQAINLSLDWFITHMYIE